MRVRVRFFAGTREAVGGAGALDVDVPDGARVADLLDALDRAHPRLARYRDCALLALDGALVSPTAPLRAGAEVAVMPPVSGGAGRLREGPVSEADALAGLRTEGAGAVVTFLGRVRPSSPGMRVAALRFEAYPEMAERELARVRDEAVAKFGLVGCEILHRLGEVRAGEPIVAVAVAAPHRREAFEACAWAMDELKRRVPVWKQEVAPDGRARWVNDPTTTEA